jgi:NitT/TauT family transport system substrate-binding protein
MVVHEIFLADFGVNGYGSIIASNQEFIAKQPAAIAAFLRAVKRGVQEIAADKQGAVQAVAKAVPEIDPKLEMKALERTLGLWTSKPGDYASFGQHSEERWQQTIEVARRVGLVEKVPAPRDVFVAGLVK